MAMIPTRRCWKGYSCRTEPELHRVQNSTTVKRRHQQFVKFPLVWADRLRTVRYTSSYRVALHLLYRHWKSGGCPIQLSNVALVEAGVSRDQKWRALRELELLGLIRIERRRRRSPLINLLVF